MNQPFTQRIPEGYLLTGIVSEEGEFVLARARQAAAPGQALLKWPAAGEPARGTVLRLEREFDLARSLGGAFVVLPLDLERPDHEAALVLEDPGGRFLAELLGAPMALPRFLGLAADIAIALADLHDRGVIHRDIRPANIMVETAGGGARLTGLGFAVVSRVPYQGTLSLDGELAGSLPYMAPEQTGRLNRPVDARSDLYSLGVVFYQMLTGERPFEATDALEWLHAHMARQPRPASERVPGVPSVLSDLVGKLLAKAPEDRYQTARGLARDLQECLGRWDATGRLDPFPLGAQDVPEQLRVPPGLYGREREVAALQAAFERVAGTGQPEVVLVSGYSGIGKSSLVRELYRPVVQGRSIFVSGKFDQYKRNVPYATIGQALGELVRQLLTSSEENLARWRDSLRAALGEDGKVVADLVPELELVIGPQPPLPDLPPAEAKLRFYKAFGALIGAVGRPGRPLALFLDDLQWLDPATLALMTHVATRPDTRNLLIIGAFRDNEVGPGHPLEGAIDELRRAGTNVSELKLPPLPFADLNRFVADALRAEPSTTGPLASLVLAKTQGNPFFVIQFLCTLDQERLLAFDRAAGRWRWDLAGIRGAGFTDNVVEFMAGKLRRLPEPVGRLLRVAAIVGDGGEIEVLARLTGLEVEEADRLLGDAAAEGLVHREGGTYRFAHDRIRQAAYSLFPEERRAAEHLRVGRLLLAAASSAELHDALFDIVGHLNLASSLIADRAERERIAALDLEAGRRAKACLAYSSGAGYLAAGVGFLAADSWETNYELAFALHFEWAGCAFLCGQFDEAARLHAALLERAGSRAERAEVLRLQADLYTTQGKNEAAVETIVACARLFGIDLPAHPAPGEVDRIAEAVWAQIGGDIEGLADRPPLPDRDWRALLASFAVALPSAFFTDFNLHDLISCKMVETSLLHGNSDASPMGYVTFGALLGSRFGQRAEAFRFGQVARKLLEEPGGSAGSRAKILHVIGCFINLWTQHFRDVLPLFREAFKAAVETGDVPFGCFVCGQLVPFRLAMGDHLDDVAAEARRCLDFTRSVRYDEMFDTMAGMAALADQLRGQTPEILAVGALDEDMATLEAKLDRYSNPMPRFCHYTYKMQAEYLAGNCEAAVLAGRKATERMGPHVDTIYDADHTFFEALALAGRAGSLGAEERREDMARLDALLARLRGWAESGPASHRNREVLVAAEQARVAGDAWRALGLFEEALREARAGDFVQNEAMASELAARHYRDLGLETGALAHLRRARDCYARWGARSKVRQIERMCLEFGAVAAPDQGATASAGAVARLEPLDLMAVIKASQAISRDIEPEILHRTLMRTMIEEAGAERGWLILMVNGEPRIEAGEAGADQPAIAPGTPVSAASLPLSLIQYVQRTRERIILADAARDSLFGSDECIARRRPRSVLCLPIVRQGELTGIVYLENNLLPGAFTPERLTVLEVLASQAAISLENTRLFVERRNAEQALREREERLHAILESSTAVIYVKDIQGRFLAINHQFEEMLGRGREEILGMTDHDFFPADQAADYRRNDLRVVETGRTLEFEEVATEGDGVHTFISIKAPLRDASGQIYATCGISTDITERKRAAEVRARLEISEQAARAEAAAARDLDRLRAQFVNSISHELRTPLTSMRGYLEFLEDEIGGTLTPDQREYVAQVDRGVVRLERLISDLLDAARIDAGTFRLLLGELDFAGVCGDIVASFKPQILEANLTLSLDIPAGRVPVVGDEQRLGQVLINLLGNAIKFTPPGGTVAVRASVASDQVRCEVQDTGAGIASQDIPRLFQRFSQLESGVRKGGGTGLGLNIARAIVEAHGGHLGIDSVPGEGSTFWFTLPVAGPGEEGGAGSEP